LFAALFISSDVDDQVEAGSDKGQQWRSCASSAANITRRILLQSAPMERKVASRALESNSDLVEKHAMARHGQTRSLYSFRPVLRVGRSVLRWLGDTRTRQLRDEVQFWRSWFATRGLEWPEDYKERLDPEYPIQEHVARYIDLLPRDPVHILDVGAGPLTKLGKVHRTKNIRITATDLLATEYGRVLEQFGIKPLVRTIFADAENLVDQFGRDSFDIVHGQNCIDHTSNPMKAIEQMIATTKPNGFTILLHAENEGQDKRYEQLHKWDFTGMDGHFIIRGPGPTGRTVDVTEALRPFGSTQCIVENNIVLAAIRKHAG
jgi:SAM-dependent methyltransferase